MRVKTILLMLAVASILSGCTLHGGAKPGVLVLVVGNLGFNSFSCDDTSGAFDDVGFETFCREAVRYTHAYSVSPLGQSAVASILTGLYPREHGVRHNGAQLLNPTIETAAEVAVKKGFATSFFSGGPPIWRRSSLGQGFATFDDNVPVSLKTLYRPASAVVDLFLRWQDSDARGGNFFSVLFLADAQFADSPTLTDLGELRESSYRGQLDEVGESLSTLVNELKKRRLWDTTNVFLVGLDGKTTNTRIDEPSSLNLYSESSHVTLMIKPARKSSEGGFNWKIDNNVSLVDVGATLYDLVDSEQVRMVSRLGAVSLRRSLDEPVADWSPNRRIITESAWAEWKGLGGIRSAIRQGPFLYIFDSNDKLYYTLTDNLETSPLPDLDPRTVGVRAELAETLRSFDYSPWVIPSSSLLETSLIGEDLWREHETKGASARLVALSKRYPDDLHLRGWRAVLALENSDWQSLADVAGKERPLWQFVAEANLGVKPMGKKKGIDEPCLRAITGKFSRSEIRRCSDETAHLLLTWANPSTNEGERDRAKEAFLRGLGTVMKRLQYGAGLVHCHADRTCHCASRRIRLTPKPS